MKKLLKNLLLFFLTIFSGTIFNLKASELETSHCHMLSVLSSKELRKEFAGFLKNVLRQVEVDTFYSLIDEILVSNPTTDSQLYAQLQEKISSIQPTFKTLSRLKALLHQKKILTQQACTLLGNKKSTIRGCIEIGTPATYLSSLANHYSFETPQYMITDQQRLSDCAQSFALNKNALLQNYQHVPLNNYEPLDTTIPENSVDLVICFIGLHHIPSEKLPDFVSSISKVLRPGGIFLLRDHDAKDDKTLSLVHSAHSVFNLIIGDQTLEQELNEYRNFQPISYWISLLEEHDLKTTSGQLLQPGDPSLNTMLSFTKQATSQSDKISIFADKLKNNDNYQKDIIQTYLTTPEWYNVDITQEYGNFINHTPFYNFPYMKSVATYWNVFNQSFLAAKKRKGTFSALTSPYTAMNIFIGITMSVEYAAKSILSWPIRALYQDSEDETLPLLIIDTKNEIDTFQSIQCISQAEDDPTIKLIKVPRYKEFLNSLAKLAKSTTISIVEIAGQKEIQLKICFDSNSALDINSIEGCSKEYEWQLPTKPDITYAAISVQVDKLLTLIKELPTKYNIEILYIHDF